MMWVLLELLGRSEALSSCCLNRGCSSGRRPAGPWVSACPRPPSRPGGPTSRRGLLRCLSGSVALDCWDAYRRRMGPVDRAPGAGRGSVDLPIRPWPCAQETRANAVAAVARRVVVAIRRPRVLGVVVEAAAPLDAASAFCMPARQAALWQRSRPF
jgi:hypothetical protein